MTALQAVLVITMTLTAYTDCDPGMRCDGIMASGLQTFDGVAACGPAFAFGTVFVVPGLNRRFVCLDRGGAIGDGNLDIWMADRGVALEFGRRKSVAWVFAASYHGGAGQW